MVVVAVIVVGVAVMSNSRMGVGTMPMVVMLDRVAAWIAGVRAEDRDQPRKYGAQQRQENNCLVHLRASPSSD